jgi:membrane protein implicated in regulation of membrane protease activity
MQFAWQVEFWHWWGLGLVLLILEVFLPGFVFLWMGIAAGITGFVLLLAPSLGWQYQIILFAVLSVTSIVLWRLWSGRRPIHTADPTLNRRAAQYVGRTFTLEVPIVNGRGHIHVDDSYWRVDGHDMPAGTPVRVVAADGVVLKVERAAGQIGGADTGPSTS